MTAAVPVKAVLIKSLIDGFLWLKAIGIPPGDMTSERFIWCFTLDTNCRCTSLDERKDSREDTETLLKDVRFSFSCYLFLLCFSLEKASQQSAWRFQDVRLLGHIIRSKILEPLVKLGSHNSVSCLASGSRGSNVHLDRWHGMIFQLCIYNFVLQNFWKYLGYISILIRIYN